MYIELQELFAHRQYVNHPIYYYFDRKTYAIVQVDKPNMKPNSNIGYYERYIPMFQVDNEKIEEAYVDSLNNPKLKKDFKESHIDIAEYLIRNYSYYKADDWYDFYYNQVCKIAILWCKNNNIRYKMSKKS